MVAAASGYICLYFWLQICLDGEILVQKENICTDCPLLTLKYVQINIQIIFYGDHLYEILYKNIYTA